MKHISSEKLIAAKVERGSTDEALISADAYEDAVREMTIARMARKVIRAKAPVIHSGT